MTDDEQCQSCHFRLTPGMYVYRVQGFAYCQGCVTGPVRIPHPKSKVPVQRKPFESEFLVEGFLVEG